MLVVVEFVSYFVVVEVLINVNKYSEVMIVMVWVEWEGELLFIVVEDDGVGGVVECFGGGFVGIWCWIEVFEGMMELMSFVGGLIILWMELLCGL